MFEDPQDSLCPNKYSKYNLPKQNIYAMYLYVSIFSYYTVYSFYILGIILVGRYIDPYSRKKRWSSNCLLWFILTGIFFYKNGKF